MVFISRIQLREVSVHRIEIPQMGFLFLIVIIFVIVPTAIWLLH